MREVSKSLKESQNVSKTFFVAINRKCVEKFQKHMFQNIEEKQVEMS